MVVDLLLDSQTRGIDLVRPAPTSKSWQDRTEGGLGHTQFQIDWERQIVTCPNGKISVRCTPRKTWRGTPSLTFVFDKEDCLPGPLRVHCSQAKNVGRTLTLYPKEQYKAQLAARQRQQTLARTHLQETASAAALNLARRFSWWSGERPKPTWGSPFSALATPA